MQVVFGLVRGREGGGGEQGALDDVAGTNDYDDENGEDEGTECVWASNERSTLESVAGTDSETEGTIHEYGGLRTASEWPQNGLKPAFTAVFWAWKGAHPNWIYLVEV